MKIGNIITCIINTNENNTHFFINTLTTNKTYKILQIQDNLILIKNDYNEIVWYYCWRFITLKQNRKQKLLKLKS